MTSSLPPKQRPQATPRPQQKPGVIIKGNQWARQTSKPTNDSRPLPAPSSVKPSSTPPAK